MTHEIEDGMGFAGPVGSTPEEKEIERLQKEVAALKTERFNLLETVATLKARMEFMHKNQVGYDPQMVRRATINNWFDDDGKAKVE